MHYIRTLQIKRSSGRPASLRDAQIVLSEVCKLTPMLLPTVKIARLGELWFSATSLREAAIHETTMLAVMTSTY